MTIGQSKQTKSATKGLAVGVETIKSKGKGLTGKFNCFTRSIEIKE
jgi:hypothetical protein